MTHKHTLSYTGKIITAAYRKNNVPDELVVYSQGREAHCMECPAHFIVHDDRRLPNKMTELEKEKQ